MVGFSSCNEVTLRDYQLKQTSLLGFSCPELSFREMLDKMSCHDVQIHKLVYLDAADVVAAGVNEVLISIPFCRWFYTQQLSD